MIKFIKRLCGCKQKPQPDVLVEDQSGGIKLYTSSVVGGRRVIVIDGRYGEVLVLHPDGTVRGGYWAKKWEAL